MKVFLGGTTNKTDWRDELIPKLKIKYFDPVVDDWDEEAYQQELKEREESDFVLYVITPKMEGVYSIAEVVDDSNKRPEKTLFCVLKEDDKKEFSDSQLKSLDAVDKMIVDNGARSFGNLNEVAEYLNNKRLIKK